MCSDHDLAHIYAQVDENGDDTMVIGYTEYNLSTKGGWEACMTTLEMVHICPVHGRTYGTEPTKCHEDWHRQCNEATYGPPCMAYGHTDRNVPRNEDEMHNELCCGQMASNCDEPMCWTHSTWTDEPFN